METLRIEIDADGLALVTLDVPQRSMNTLTAQVLADLQQVVARVGTDPEIKGVVIASGKSRGFCAGADLGELGAADEQSQPTAPAEESLRKEYKATFMLTGLLRALETCGKPVATALEGLALGGGLELALATHYRVATDNPRIQLGLPEAKIGLMPGAGGTQRLPRLLGLKKAVPLLLEGRSLDSREALACGLVHEVVPEGQAIAAAMAWVKRRDTALAPWDRAEFQPPGGGPYDPVGGEAFRRATAVMRARSAGNYPAQINILKSVYEGMLVPFDTALRIEVRYFMKTLATPQATSMMRSLFTSMQELRSGANRVTRTGAKFEPRKVAVLGAGMMGAGIAYVQAMAGIETALIDVSLEAARKGKSHAMRLLDDAVAGGRLKQVDAERTLRLIHPSADYDDVAGAELVIEAVFEDREVKASATRTAESRLAPQAVFGTNTSTLPVSSLATVSVRPENFVGIHFFSPVDRMGLVEIIVGKQTAPDTVAKAIDYVAKIRKTPIVVNDFRDFYTSRCFGTYLSEGLEMLLAGIAPALIENIGRASGMPRGPLELSDDIGLDLMSQVARQTRADLKQASAADNPRDALIDNMVALGRHGRKNGKGFYDYPTDGGPKRLWTGLARLIEPRINRLDAPYKEEIRLRLLYRQALEAVRCLQEGVVTDPRSVDVGAILGWGFARWTGGPLSLIDAVGGRDFVATCDRLARAYGQQFEVPQLLRQMAADGRTFYRKSSPEARQ